MADVVDALTRSRMMSGIKGKDTIPELTVRRYLHANGFRFRLHDARFPGKPDLVLPKYGAVIFVHGCFWHAHDCSYFKWPKTRPEFWKQKVLSNVSRDERARAGLMSASWRVAVVWECNIRRNNLGRESALRDLVAWLRSNEPSFDSGIPKQTL